MPVPFVLCCCPVGAMVLPLRVWYCIAACSRVRVRVCLCRCSPLMPPVDVRLLWCACGSAGLRAVVAARVELRRDGDFLFCRRRDGCVLFRLRRATALLLYCFTSTCLELEDARSLACGSVGRCCVCSIAASCCVATSVDKDGWRLLLS